jgi:hypothetical protein
MAEFGDVDPYKAPRSETVVLSGSGSGAEGAPLEWEPVEALRFGFESLKRQPIHILTALLATVIGSALPSIAGFAPQLFAATDTSLVWLGWVIYVAGFVINLPLQAWMGLGQARIALALARGERPDLSQLFRAEGLMTALGAQLLWLAAFVIGAAFLLLPGGFLLVRDFQADASEPNLVGVALLVGGILGYSPCALFFSARFCLLMPAIAERPSGALAAFGISWRLTAGQLWVLVLFGLLVMVLFVVAYILGLLLCCVGVLATIPAATMIFYVALCYAYLRRSGREPVLSAA